VRIGIDLGGTKIEAIALDDDGTIVERQRRPTPRGDYRATVEAIAGLVEMIEAQTGVASVGIGTPGVVSPATGRMKNSNSVWLIGHELDKDLEERLGRPIRITNDANCFALSEAIDGTAADADVVFGVILGTGVGGGVIINKRPLVGRNAIAGEWGHNPLPAPQPSELPGSECYCGRHGCIETFLSGPGLERDYAKKSPDRVRASEIVVRAEKGEREAEQAIVRYEDRLARALGSVINVLDPEVIVLGGGLSNIERLYENVPACWAQYIFSDRVDTRLVPPRYGGSSGVRGAAWLWPPE
jgi:fructokinase